MDHDSTHPDADSGSAQDSLGNPAWFKPLLAVCLVATLIGGLGLEVAGHAAVVRDRTLALAATPGHYPADIVYGNPRAPVEVVALLSLTCSHCHTWETTVMPDLLAGPVAAGNASLILRAMPLDAPALDGAAVLACLPDASRPTAQANLVANQGWIGRALPSVAIAAGVAPESAADVAQCAGSVATRQAVTSGAIAARHDWGVSATPSFVVGRRVVAGEQSLSALNAMIATARAQADAAAAAGAGIPATPQPPTTP